MGNEELISFMRKCSLEGKDSLIRIDNRKILQVALSLLINRSSKRLDIFILFEEGKVNELFEVLNSSIVIKNTADYLDLSSTKLTLMTNQPKKVRSSDFFKSIQHKETFVKSIAGDITKKLTQSGTKFNFILGDNVSFALGGFEFSQCDSMPSFCNFNSSKHSGILSIFYNELLNQSLNGGVNA
ncbi:hypothetical protein [Aeromonas veronii]|uniref:hypothetical protein n=1 Tax=Aeromonas veronii TaxID=654 RepID=UPI003D19A033